MPDTARRETPGAQQAQAGRRYLVTGGAGYVGSHLVLELHYRGAEVVVIDNLQQGHKEALPADVRLVCASLADTEAVEAVLAAGPWDALFHFAARSLVGESMQEPLRYLIENGSGGLWLVDLCVRHGVPRFVLSSTANLFGHAQYGLIDEDAPIAPSSPYGESKLMIERALYWADRRHGLRSACLRYFNAAGADPLGRLGEDHAPETHLIPLAIDAALGRRPPLVVFGNDYPTADGTCVRDYVHVTDLADAHLRVLTELDDRSVTYNLGNGTGHSVQDVLNMVGTVLGRPVPHTFGDRRPGDPASLVASSRAIGQDTGWTARHSSLLEIVQTAAAWRIDHPDGYAPVVAVGRPTGGRWHVDPPFLSDMTGSPPRGGPPSFGSLPAV